MWFESRRILNKNLNAIYLPSFLFLTLSNFSFLVPIYISLRRQLFVESFVYTINMFLSIVSLN